MQNRFLSHWTRGKILHSCNSASFCWKISMKHACFQPAATGERSRVHFPIWMEHRQSPKTPSAATWIQDCHSSAGTLPYGEYEKGHVCKRILVFQHHMAQRPMQGALPPSMVFQWKCLAPSMALSALGPRLASLGLLPGTNGSEGYHFSGICFQKTWWGNIFLRTTSSPLCCPL